MECNKTPDAIIFYERMFIFPSSCAMSTFDSKIDPNAKNFRIYRSTELSTIGRPGDGSS
jgi:hypothetical protein